MAATIVLSGKSLTLTLGATEYHQQTTRARIDVEPVTEEVAPIGVDPVTVTSGARRTLNLTALQDWPESASLCRMIEEAWEAGATLDFVLTLTGQGGTTTPGEAIATGTAQAQPVPFGGEAGILTSDIALPILTVAYTYTAPVMADAE